MRISLIGISVLICRHQFYPYNPKFHTAEENEKLQKETHRSWKPDEGSRNFQQGETARAAYAKTQVQMRQWNNELNRYAEYKKLCAEREEKPAYQTLGSFRRAYRSEEESLSYAKSHYARRDANEYNEFEKVIGKANMPKTLADFQELKYNNKEEFRALHHYRYARDKGKISALVSISSYKDIKTRIENITIGKTAANGIVVKSVSLHFVDRLIGTIYEKNKHEGMSLKDMKNILFNGKPKKVKVDLNGKKSQNIVIEGIGIVTINPETGELIQCNKK